MFAVKSNLVEKVAAMVKYRSKHLNLWVVKFFKAIIRSKEEMLLAYVVRKDLFKCVMDIFIENVDKPNLLHSCILEMFDTLTKEYNKTLG